MYPLSNENPKFQVLFNGVFKKSFTMNSMINAQKVEIHPSWKKLLQSEFEKPYFTELKAALLKEKRDFVVYPKGNEIFNAFNFTPPEELKAVILGQDPYHGQGQAHGLSFSVQKGVRIPPSLKNMYKELEADLGITAPNHGNLTSWAKNGVLLLNAMLTVRQGDPGSHQKLGWQTFTDAVIKTISDHKDHVAFVLWGNFAISKSHLIDESKHMIHTSPHPSPFSANRGFFGSGPYSKVNAFLESHQIAAIDWHLDS